MANKALAHVTAANTSSASQWSIGLQWGWNNGSTNVNGSLTITPVSSLTGQQLNAAIKQALVGDIFTNTGVTMAAEDILLIGTVAEF